jgi:hypothetical protein
VKLRTCEAEEYIEMLNSNDQETTIGNYFEIEKIALLMKLMKISLRLRRVQ